MPELSGRVKLRAIESLGEVLVMNVAERKLGLYTAYAAALDAGATGGYHAAVVVNLSQGAGLPRLEVFRDEQLDDSRVWDCPRQALAYALDVGEAASNAHEVFGDFDHWQWLGSNAAVGSQSLRR